jgi:AcrR family transcriptional regulator
MSNAAKSEWTAAGLGRHHHELSNGAAAIVSAGIDVMSERGYHAASIRTIAERAQMSTSNLYHHFASKQALLYVIMSLGIDTLREDTDAALASAPQDPASQLAALVRVHVISHAMRGKSAFVTSSELRSLEPEDRRKVRAKLDVQQRCFDRIVSTGIERGVFETPFGHGGARAVASMCTAVATWFDPHGSLDAAEVAEQYVHFSQQMLGLRSNSVSPPLEGRLPSGR